VSRYEIEVHKWVLLLELLDGLGLDGGQLVRSDMDLTSPSGLLHHAGEKHQGARSDQPEADGAYIKLAALGMTIRTIEKSRFIKGGS
jgi:hypothetical protein